MFFIFSFLRKYQVSLVSYPEDVSNSKTSLPFSPVGNRIAVSRWTGEETRHYIYTTEEVVSSIWRYQTHARNSLSENVKDTQIPRLSWVQNLVKLTIDVKQRQQREQNNNSSETKKNITLRWMSQISTNLSSRETVCFCGEPKPPRFNDCSYQDQDLLNREMQYHSCVRKDSSNGKGSMAFLKCNSRRPMGYGLCMHEPGSYANCSAWHVSVV